MGQKDRERELLVAAKEKELERYGVVRTFACVALIMVWPLPALCVHLAHAPSALWL